MISDYRDELALFEGYMPYYEDMSDLIFKIESYLQEKDAYKMITEKCYEIAKQNHNSKSSVAYILKMVK